MARWDNQKTLNRELDLKLYTTSLSTSHIGRVIARGMLDNGYTYAELARIAGLKDGTHIRMIVKGVRRDPQFSTVAKLATALDLKLDRFLE